MNTARIELLQGMPFFGGVRDDILDFLLEASSTATVPKGGFFFRENDRATSLFVLEEGKVAILKQWEGKQYHQRYLGRGDCFGEMALIDLRPRSASVLAVEDCKAIKITTRVLQQLLRKDLEQYALIQMNMGREVSRRLRAADERLFKNRIEARVVDGDYTFEST